MNASRARQGRRPAPREPAGRAATGPARSAPTGAGLPLDFPPTEPPAGRPAYVVALALAALWALGLGVLAAPLPKTPAVLTLLVLLAAGPAALVFGVAYAVGQGRRLASASRRPAGDDFLLWPALRAAVGAGDATGAMQAELFAARAAAHGASEAMASLRRALSGEHDVIRTTAALLAEAQGLAGQVGAGRRGLEALSQALDAQLAQAAEVIERQVGRVTRAARAAERRFQEADLGLKARAEALGPAADQAAAAVRAAAEEARRNAERLEGSATGLAAPAEGLDRKLSEHRAGLLALAQSLRAEREAFIGAAGAQLARLQAFIGQLARAGHAMDERAREAGASLAAASSGAEPPQAAAAPEPAAPPPPESPPETTSEPVTARPPESPSKTAPAPPPAPLVTARGLGGRVVFDGFRILIDRTQSASFVLHGSGGQRSILLSEVVKVRLAPPRPGAHGYLQLVLSRGGVAGRGGPADVNSILFEAAEQAQFQALAEAVRRAARHLRRRPLVSDPRASGEMAHLLDLRGRGLINAQEFAEASARLETRKRDRRPSFLRRKRR